LERALRDRTVDLAVHSAKDVPSELADGLAIVGVPAREDPRDALCGAPSLRVLAPGARVGTSSPRRRAALLAVRRDLRVVELRGNVDTRLRKLEEGEVDAAVLALAGLRRLGREAAATAVLDVAQVVPAAGQGALILEARSDDAAARAAAASITDARAFACVRAERALVERLQATCHTPVGACATQSSATRIDLLAFVGRPDGSAAIVQRHSGDAAAPEAIGAALAERLLAAGAEALLRA
jgi:hydroxymethylbilane synthase